MQRFFYIISIFIFIFLLFSKSISAQENNIVIANASPFGGKAGIYGEQIRKGIAFAVENINSKGGINGQKIKILSYNDACDPKEAEKMAKIITSSDGVNVREKVMLIVGHTCMASTVITAPIYAKADLIHFIPSSLDNLDNIENKNAFVLDANIERRASVAASFLNKNFKPNKIAIIYDDNNKSKNIAELVNNNLQKISDKEVYFASFVSGLSDYTGLIDALSKKSIDVVYLATSLYDAQNIINQMKNKNFKSVYISSNPFFGDGNFNPDFNGKIFFSFMPDARYLPEASSAVSRFRVSGFEPEGLTLYALATIEAFAAAYKKSKNKTVTDISNILKNTVFETSVGEIGFNLSGEITGLLPTVYEWKNGTYTEVTDNF